MVQSGTRRPNNGSSSPLPQKSLQRRQENSPSTHFSRGMLTRGHEAGRCATYPPPDASYFPSHFAPFTSYLIHRASAEVPHTSLSLPIPSLVSLFSLPLLHGIRALGIELVAGVSRVWGEVQESQDYEGTSREGIRNSPCSFADLVPPGLRGHRCRTYDLKHPSGLFLPPAMIYQTRVSLASHFRWGLSVKGSQ